MPSVSVTPGTSSDGPAVRRQVEGGAEGLVPGRGADRVGPRTGMIGRARAGAAVAGRGVDLDAGRVRVQEGELDRVGVGVGATGDREVDDVDAIEDGLLYSGHRVGLEAAVGVADAIFDDRCAGGHAADRTALDAKGDRRVDQVAGGSGRGVCAVAISIARAAVVDVRAELAGRGRDRSLPGWSRGRHTRQASCCCM